jgi:hypothetical protein
MKKIKHLKASWYFGSMVIAVVIGELAGRLVAQVWGVRVPPVPLGAVCIGLVAFVTSLIYDGSD